MLRPGFEPLSLDPKSNALPTEQRRNLGSVRPNPNGSAERSAKLDRTGSAERYVMFVRSSVRPILRKFAIFASEILQNYLILLFSAN